MTAQPDFELYADQKSFNETIPPGWQAAFEEVVTAMDVPRDRLRFLDVGCGDGKFYRHLLREGLIVDNIHGVEVSRKRVERCHALGWANARYVEDGISLPYADDSMDLVNLMEVIEHVPGGIVDALLAEIARVLRPNGRLLISTPNYPAKRFYDFWDAFVHRKWSRLKDDPTHVSLYNHDRLTARLRRHFGRLDERPFKDGFLYARLPRPAVRHKIFFICAEPN